LEEGEERELNLSLRAVLCEATPVLAYGASVSSTSVCHDKKNSAKKKTLFFFLLDRSHAERVMLGTGQFSSIKI
jgi:hypothetical protein